MKRIVIARIVGRTDDDIVFRIQKADWLTYHYANLDAEDIISEPFENIEDLKFEKGKIGCNDTFTDKQLANLAERAKKAITINADGTIPYRIFEKHLDGNIVNAYIKNFYTNAEANAYVSELKESRHTYWGFELARKDR